MEVGTGKAPPNSRGMEVPHTDTGDAFAGDFWHCRAAVQRSERDGGRDAKVCLLHVQRRGCGWDDTQWLTCYRNLDSTASALQNLPCKCLRLSKRDGQATSKHPSSSTTMRP